MTRDRARRLLLYRPAVIGAVLWVLGGLAGMPGCTGAYEAFLNNTASLGGSTPGQRGSLAVAFINRTPYRAVFTFGTYDPQDENSVPIFSQFYVDPIRTPDGFNRGLEGNESSGVISFLSGGRAFCGRMLSLGGEEMIRRIRSFNATRLNDGVAPDAAALKPGIAFSGKPIDDTTAPPDDFARRDAVDTLQGASYPCGALVIYTFEVDPQAPQGIRIDMEFIPEDQTVYPSNPQQ